MPSSASSLPPARGASTREEPPPAGLLSVRSYAVVTGAYWAFTLTDGALRMLVLLHFHSLGYSPFQLALLFLLYEFLGAVTNLCGGAIATRVGLKRTLLAGLSLQVGALLMLSCLDATWTVPAQVAFVLVAQGLSGVAKDLTKLAAKTSIKYVVPEGSNAALFKWVALLTGSKNALKGAGFFAGGLLLAGMGFRPALRLMAAVIALAAIATAFGLPSAFGRAKKKALFSRVFAKTRAINILSAARVFLFGARDVWFVVALPVFMSQTLNWEFAEVGTFMALWVIGYGVVQSLAPRLLRHRANRNDAHAAKIWGLALAGSAFAVAVALTSSLSPTVTVLVGLGAFGVLFAVNSAVHSYLILVYSSADSAAADVGFYYMANAVGRLLGTLLSGLVFQAYGLAACLLTAGGMLLVAAALAFGLPDTRVSGRATEAKA